LMLTEHVTYITSSALWCLWSCWNWWFYSLFCMHIKPKSLF
jgi:hypothetical protein